MLLCYGGLRLQKRDERRAVLQLEKRDLKLGPLRIRIQACELEQYL